jgi:hypothetical protein
VADSLTLGAHLTTPRWGFVHHGLYVGNGRVIHYAGFKGWLRCGPVEEVSIAEFGGGRPVQVTPRSASRYAGIAAVRRARSRLGENRYRLLFNNCEHFVEWCLSGTSRSSQVEALFGARTAAAA